MRRDVGQEAVDAAYEELGEPDSSYVPPSGPTVAGITVMLTRPDTTVGFESQAVIPEQAIAVRASEAIPAKGGRFIVPVRDEAFAIIGTETFQIIAEPQQRDAVRLEWTAIVKQVG